VIGQLKDSQISLLYLESTTYKTAAD